MDIVGKEFSAYSIFEKALEGENRTIEGIATTPTVDRVGDIVDPAGAVFAKEIPLLWQHERNKAVGIAKLGTVTKKGIPFEAEIPKVLNEGRLKEHVDHAWDSVKHGLIRAVSIGFRVLEGGYELLEDGGILFKEYEIFELSLVSIPANAEATIEVVRSIVAPARTLGNTKEQRSAEVVQLTAKNIGVKPMAEKTLQEQIDEAKAAQTAKKTEMNAITRAAADAGTTLDAEQAQQFDDALAEANALGQHIKRLEAQQALDVESAEPVGDVKTVKTGVAARSVSATNVKRKLPQGTVFTRMAIATALGRGSRADTLEIAKARFSDTPEVEAIIRAAVTPVATTDTSVAYDANFAQNEFLELLRGKTIFDRIKGKRQIPFDTKVRVGSSAATAYWVGEGAPKPVSKVGLSEIELKRHKLAALCVLTEEALQRTGWATETYVRDEMIKAVVETMDVSFIDGLVGNSTRPSAINAGVVGVAATGTSADDFEADLQTVSDNLFDANIDSAGLVWLMNPKQASRIGRIKNALGQKEYPEINKDGGELDASDVITSTRVPNGKLILLAADNLYFAKDDNMILRSSNQASIRMSSDPAGDAATIDYESMFQENKVALLAEQYVTWIRGRDEAVQEITGANYA